MAVGRIAELLSGSLCVGSNASVQFSCAAAYRGRVCTHFITIYSKSDQTAAFDWGHVRRGIQPTRNTTLLTVFTRCFPHVCSRTDTLNITFPRKFFPM